MIFQLPQALSTWNHSSENWGLELRADVKEWLLSNGVLWDEWAVKDKTKSILQNLFIEIENDSQAMLFKLTWL